MVFTIRIAISVNFLMILVLLSKAPVVEAFNIDSYIFGDSETSVSLLHVLRTIFSIFS
jgi:hypothetical protein